MSSLLEFGVEDFERTIRTLMDTTVGMTPVATRWRQRAVFHLSSRLDQELHGGTLPPSDEQMASNLLRSAGNDLRAAQTALYAAAERLRSRGDSFGASNARKAGTEAHEAAEGIWPSEPELTPP
jgi:K+-sensing histidine kinase KdpD